MIYKVRVPLAGILLAIPAVLAFPVSPALADLTLGVSPTSALAGGTGAFDVTLTDTSGAFNIGGFAFDLSVAPVSGISFTGADMNTANPYVFSGNSFDLANSLPFTTSTFPTTEVNGSDLANAGSTSITTGVTLGLGDITYTVAPGTAPGPVTITFMGIGGLTSLSDELGNNLTFTVSPASIDVNAPSGTPEPGAFAFITCIGIAGSVFMRRRRTNT